MPQLMRKTHPIYIPYTAAILIALLMEEEIPTGLYLLRRIPKQYLKSKCPEISYPRFVGSSLLRISMGYLFLVNVVIVLIQADEVIMSESR